MHDANVGSVDVAIGGNGFPQAVTVIGNQEGGELKIREVEWSRPWRLRSVT